MCQVLIVLFLQFLAPWQQQDPVDVRGQCVQQGDPRQGTGPTTEYSGAQVLGPQYGSFTSPDSINGKDPFTLEKGESGIAYRLVLMQSNLVFRSIETKIMKNSHSRSLLPVVNRH